MTYDAIAVSSFLALASLLTVPSMARQASAQEIEPVPTRVNVHVVARDAKLIGTSVGGAEVVVRDAASGEVLARGIHEGGTGDTGLIMGDRERNADVFTTPGAAGHSVELPLRAPRMVRIEAAGPVDYPAARATATTTVLLVPGRHVDGDGVVLELWGYIVEILEAPETAVAGRDLEIVARVRMLCSCPTEPGGLWEAGEVTARLLDGERNTVTETGLAFSGGESEYEGRLTAPATGGEYTLEVIASSTATGNAGNAQTEVRVRNPGDDS